MGPNLVFRVRFEGSASRTPHMVRKADPLSASSHRQILFSTNQIFHQKFWVSPKFFGFRQDRQTDRRKKHIVGLPLLKKTKFRINGSQIIVEIDEFLLHLGTHWVLTFTYSPIIVTVIRHR